MDGDAPVDAPWEDAARAFMIDFLHKVDGKQPVGWKNASQLLYDPKVRHRSFRPAGHRITAPFEVSQSIADYLRCEHSRATWSEDHLGEEASAEFDAGMTELLTPYAKDGMLTFSVQTRIEWGRIVA